MKNVRETVQHPKILHLSYPTENSNGYLDIPDFLEEEIFSNDVIFD